MKRWLYITIALLFFVDPASAQTGPSPSEERAYTGLHAAAATGNIEHLHRLISQGANLEARDSSGRTPLHVAAFKSDEDIVNALAKAGADMNALEGQAYDIVTIAAVANDAPMMRLALTLGNSPKNTTSPYDGTALIAAAHLGYVEIVRTLIKAGAPLDHVNNLGWTALMEAVVLGDGGVRHQDIVTDLIKAGANVSIPDRDGITPLAHAKDRGYADMVRRFPEAAN